MAIYKKQINKQILRMKRNRTFIYSIKIQLYIYKKVSIEKQNESQKQYFNKVDKFLNMSLSNLKVFVE